MVLMSDIQVSHSLLDVVLTRSLLSHIAASSKRFSLPKLSRVELKEH